MLYRVDSSRVFNIYKVYDIELASFRQLALLLILLVMIMIPLLYSFWYSKQENKI